MPIYEYKCLDCGSHVEKMQKVADEPLTVCEKCGGKLEKQWSLSGFQFKGAGWYVTDYADKSGDKSKEKAAEKSEKSLAAESTVKTEAASKKANDAAASSKKETVSKKE
jgi:putative FmdB family regulatory protein